jgi:hypothetical protein
VNNERAAAAGPQAVIGPRFIHAGRPDGQYYDEVRIVTVPRWKESELSGDEWRISARVDFMLKGVIVDSVRATTVDYAARFLPWTIVKAREDGVGQPSTDAFCDQESCTNTPTTFYKLKAEYDSAGHKTELPRSWDHPETVYFRKFCAFHKRRGDCGLDDADANYVEIERPRR